METTVILQTNEVTVSTEQSRALGWFAEWNGCKEENYVPEKEASPALVDAPISLHV